MPHQPMDPDALIEHVVLFVNTMRHGPVGRLRIAVSPEEYMALRECMMERYGKFYGRIANVPLVIDPEADEPVLKVELKP